MNPEIKKEWLEALRSGEYKQGNRCLFLESKDGDKSFCCLGVLMDLMTKKHPDSFSWADRFKLSDSNDLFQGLLEHINKDNDRTSSSLCYIPLTASSITEITFLEQTKLAKMNDAGKSFEDISDWIEKNL